MALKKLIESTIAVILFIISNLVFSGEIKMDEIPNKNISIEQLEEMFANIDSNTNWDMSSPMLWGYFFTHNEPTKLEKAKEILTGKGYKFVDIFISDKEEENEPDTFWLHIEKVETHTPVSLDKRNDEFYIFANDFGLDSYDGMDIGSPTN
jgi:hypothetical protein